MVQVKKKVKKATLKDIAAKAGLSVPTVSQILNNKGNNYCSEEKKDLVKRIARELNYQPNFGYKIMCGQKTNTVGIICSQERVKHEEHISALLLTLSTELEKKKYSVYMSTMSESASANKRKILDLIGRGCSSFIFVGAPVGIDDIAVLLKQQEINYISTHTNLDRSVISDRTYALEIYIEKLLKDGFSNFRLLLPEDIKAEDKFGRINGLIETFPETDPQELLARYVRRFPGVGFLDRDSSSETFEMGYRATRRLLEEEPDVNGIVYLSDYYALGGAKYLIEKGCKIGKDIAIAGFNNTNAVRFSGIPVMTADHRVDVISKKLIDNIEGREPYSSIVKPEVIFY